MSRVSRIAGMSVLVMVLCLPPTVGRAAPSGAGNVLQIPLLVSGVAGGTVQDIFLTSDPVTFQALYYDPNPACAGTPPAAINFYVMTAAGQLLLSIFGSVDGVVVSSSPGTPPNYRILTVAFPAGQFAAGSYRAVLAVGSCTGGNITISQFRGFGVVNP